MNIKLFVLLFLLTGLNVNESDAQSDLKIDGCEPVLKLYPVLWQQKAAEYKALCYQAFNFAILRLNASALESGTHRQQAVITDLDETILDNSYFYAQLILDGKIYSDLEWKKWTDQSIATAVPGAIEFLQYAKSKGFSIFYVSNRDTSEIRSTLKNLVALKLPDAIPSHMLFKTDTYSKETRRQKVDEIYDVVLLLGDNLNDFMDIFRNKSIPERSEAADDEKEKWGSKFIVLPNSYYGEWENSFFNNANLNTQQKDSVLINSLIGY